MSVEIDDINPTATLNVIQPEPIPSSFTHERQEQRAPSQFASFELKRKASRQRSEV